MLNLFNDNKGKTSSFIIVPLSEIEISKHNPRRTRDQKHVENIAESIQKNGFDHAFAIKCHTENGKYYAFAGGTRLTACKSIGLQNVPILIYEGYTDAEIWAMAYKDQDQGKTQKHFSIVDVWLDYKAKSEQGYTQQQIADSLGIARPTVNYRLQLSNLPKIVLDKIVNSDVLQERSCLEFIKLSTVDNFYIPYETCLLEIIDNVLAKTSTPTAKSFESEITKYNSLIACYEKYEGQLTDFYEEFRNELITKKIRNEGEMKSVFNQYLAKIEKKRKAQEDAKMAELNKLEKDRLQAERHAKKAKAENEVLDRISNSDCREFFAKIINRIKVVLTDPPYGMDFQSNRRTATNKLAKIENDADLETALQLCEEVFTTLYEKMTDDATLYCFCNWKNEFQFRQMIEKVGFTIKGSLIWVKSNHGTGDLQGTFAPKHERIIHAVKGKPILNKRLPDVLQGNEFLETDHPTPKPIDLLKNLIDCSSEEGDFIADPFLGCGSTAMAALENNRNFLGSEINRNYYGEALTNVSNLLNQILP